jgi:hypothetical protein
MEEMAKFFYVSFQGKLTSPWRLGNILQGGDGTAH